jgi:predicted enzyme related to lactoylglutathione lyase
MLTGCRSSARDGGVVVVRVVEVIADLAVGDIASAQDFYADYLGLSVEEFNLGWVARFTSPSTGAHVQLVTRDETAAENPVVSIKVDDVEAAYEEARRRGYEIVHPLTDEPWGVRRFFVRAPDGNVANVVQHHDS